MASDDPFTSKIRQILSKIPGFDGDPNDIDFGWMQQSNDEELTKFCDWFTNNITDENFVTEEELSIVSKLKEDGLYLESEDSINEALGELNYNDTIITEADNQVLQTKLTVMDENISNLTKLYKFTGYELKNISDDIVQLEQDYQFKKADLNCLVATFHGDDLTISSMLEEINSNYPKYIETLEDIFSNKMLNPNFLNQTSLLEFNIQNESFREKVLKYIRSCHKYSSIPLPLHDNSIQNISCLSLSCSLAGRDSAPMPDSLLYELHNINLSMKKKYFNKHILQGTIEGLRFSKSKFDEMRNSLDSVWSDIIEWNSKQDRHQESSFYKDTFDSIKSLVKINCEKWVDLQIACVFINIMKEKMIERVTKLNVQNNFLILVRRNKAIVDLLWIIIKMQQEILYSPMNDLKCCLKKELENYKRRMDYMELILAKNDSQLMVEPVPLITCLKEMLPQATGKTECMKDIISTASAVMNVTEEAEQTLCHLLKRSASDLTGRCCENAILKNLIFDGPTKSINFSDKASKIKIVEDKIKTLGDMIKSGLSDHETQLSLHEESSTDQTNFNWISDVIDLNKPVEASEESSGNYEDE